MILAVAAIRAIAISGIVIIMPISVVFILIGG
jgi:hypothetical protein